MLVVLLLQILNISSTVTEGNFFIDNFFFKLSLLGVVPFSMCILKKELIKKDSQINLKSSKLVVSASTKLLN